MKALVIGAGMQGSALAYDFAHSDGVEEVHLADIDEGRARRVATSIGPKVKPFKLDLTVHDHVVRMMKDVHVAVGATSYNHNYQLTLAAIEAGVHFCDLGGNMDVVDKQLTLDAKAKERGICVMPNFGLAPGMACVIAAGGARQFERVDEIHIRVGGLPQHPVPPLQYQLVFSVEGLINEYLEPAEVIRNGALQRVESMIECEELEFPPPFGKLEAFNTSGGISTLTRMFNGRVREMDYKTIRYKGHCEKFKALLDLGFASSEPMALGGHVLTAREYFQHLLLKRLPSNGPDIVLMRVTIYGLSGGTKKTLAYEMIDYYDTRLQMTSMMRTTAFPTSIGAQMAGNGQITARGVIPPEQCVPLEPFLRELQKRNIVIKQTAI